MIGTAFRYVELREGGIAVDEGRAGNRNVFVAPEPATAGEVKEKVGTRADTLPGFAALAMIAPTVVDVAPPISEPERLQATLDEA
jgi:hypothetical protein